MSLCRHGFSISSRWQLLMIGISGLWSVMTEKCCKPTKKSMHFITAQHIASISNSIMAYQNSASVRKWEPAWISFHVVPLLCCCKIKPGTYQLHPCTSEWAYWHHKLTALVLLSVHPLLLWLHCHVYRSTKIILKFLVDECSEWC